MNYLSAELVAKTFNDKWLFKDISLGIAKGEKFALVGNNGVGFQSMVGLAVHPFSIPMIAGADTTPPMIKAVRFNASLRSINL